MKEIKNDIYPKRKFVFQKEEELLSKEKISEQNKTLIKSFNNYIFSTGSGNLRVAKLSSQLRRICKWIEELNIKSNLDNLNKNDIMNLVSYLNRLPNKAENTKADYRRCIKQFYKWYKEEDNKLFSKDNSVRFDRRRFYNYIEKDISIKSKPKQADPNTIIKEDDVLTVIEKGAKDIKEKAFISLLHETGLRASEFLNLKIGNIEIKDNYGELHVPDGKTGQRVIYFTKSIPYIIPFLDSHIDKNNSSAFLWVCNAHNKRAGKPLVHIGGQRLIQRCFERAGVKKKHNFHWFRHSRATILAPKLTEVMLCKYMGWTIGSKQVKNYVHLCSQQLEDVFLSMNGIKPREELENKPIKCTCGTLNKHTERYCFKCYKPLNVDVVIQDKELVDTEINKTMSFFMEMAKNPELMKRFEEFKNNVK